MRIASILVAWTLGLASLGCGRAKDSPPVPQSTSSSSPAPSVTLDPSSPPTPADEPSGPVGSTDSLMRALTPALDVWVTWWRQALPGFLPDSLYRIRTTRAFSDAYTSPLAEPDPENRIAFAVLSDPSPDGRWVLVFDRYRMIDDRGGRLEFSGEPDSGPLLMDRRLRTMTSFSTCGTQCGYEWGRWIDSTGFVLAGTESSDDHRQTRAFLQVYSLRDSSLARYVTRWISRDETSPHGKARRRWLEARYRAWAASERR